MIDPELKPFLAMWDKAWSVLPANATPQQRRDLIEKISDEMREPLPAEIADETQHVPCKDGSVRVRIFRHKTEPVAPCLIYLHGGGWMQGSPETHDAITIGVAQASRHTVVSVDYALAPEHPFPIALHQCEAVVKWVFDNAAALRIRPGAISVGGDSAGANLAAALTLVFRGTRCAPNGQVLFYPAVDTAQTRPSYAENAEGPIIKTANMAGTLALYCPNPAELRNPLVAPLLASDHRGLPPAFIAIAEHDPLRDDGAAYAEALSAAGVPVQLDRGKGLIHGYLRAMSYCAASRAGLAAASAWLVRLNQEARSGAAAS